MAEVTSRIKQEVKEYLQANVTGILTQAFQAMWQAQPTNIKSWLAEYLRSSDTRQEPKETPNQPSDLKEMEKYLNDAVNQAGLNEAFQAMWSAKPTDCNKWLADYLDGVGQPAQPAAAAAPAPSANVAAPTALAEPAAAEKSPPPSEGVPPALLPGAAEATPAPGSVAPALLAEKAPAAAASTPETEKAVPEAAAEPSIAAAEPATTEPDAAATEPAAAAEGATEPTDPNAPADPPPEAVPPAVAEAAVAEEKQAE